MEGYKKVQMSDHTGDVLFPESVADVIRETPNRRFVDHGEKTILGHFASNPTVSEMLVQEAQAIKAIATNEVELLSMLDTFPSNFDDLTYIVGELGGLVPHKAEILSSIGSALYVTSATTGLRYLLDVDDSIAGKPVIKLILDTVGEGDQPISYKMGQRWTVGENTLNVDVNIPAAKIIFETKEKTILALEEALLKDSVSSEILESLNNGVIDINIDSEDGGTPQGVVVFEVKKALEEYFGSPDLEKTITAFTSSVLVKPVEKEAFIQTYRDGNVVQPSRKASQTGDYSEATFSDITWLLTITEEFLNSWLNSIGQAAISVFGQTDGTVSLTKPTLGLKIKNPYIGKTIEATKDMGDKFDIRDWKVVD